MIVPYLDIDVDDDEVSDTNDVTLYGCLDNNTYFQIERIERYHGLFFTNTRF